MISDGSGGVWLRGLYGRSKRLSRTGRWSAALPKVGDVTGELKDLAQVPGSTSIWGAGRYLPPSGPAAGVIWRLTG